MAVIVNKDIERVVPPQHWKSMPYAQKGQVGTITEIFRPVPTGYGEIKPLYAKVKINDQIKTFRLTSLDII